MAWGSVGALGSNSNKTANQATHVMPLDVGAADAGNFALFCVGVDNNATTDGDEGAISAVTDSTGANTWSKLKEFTNGQGNAQAGIVVSCWGSVISTTIPFSTGTITATFTNTASRDASTSVGWEFTLGAGSTVTVQASATNATDGADPASMSISGMPSGEYLFVHGLGAEGPGTDAYTVSTNYTLGNSNGTTGGGAASNAQVIHEFRIFTGTGDSVDITSTTADRDYAQIYVALKENAAGAGPAPALFTRSLTGAGL